LTKGVIAGRQWYWDQWPRRIIKTLDQEMIGYPDAHDPDHM
jgi:hypothetical protein